MANDFTEALRLAESVIRYSTGYGQAEAQGNEAGMAELHQEAETARERINVLGFNSLAYYVGQAFTHDEKVANLQKWKASVVASGGSFTSGSGLPDVDRTSGGQEGGGDLIDKAKGLLGDVGGVVGAVVDAVASTKGLIVLALLVAPAVVGAISRAVSSVSRMLNVRLNVGRR